jgi:hypothetical protein
MVHMRLPLLCAASLLAVSASALQFSVRFAATAFEGPFSGRVVVYLSEQRGEPRFGPNWFNPQPTYAKFFKGVKPGDSMAIGEDALSFPAPLRNLKPGRYTVQAVIDRNLGGRTIGGSPGNLYSAAAQVDIDGSADKTIEILCDRVVEDRLFEETDSVKAARMQSQLLSKFYERPTVMRAAVVLPESWSKETDHKYPVIYEIPGFGGSFLDLSGMDAGSRSKRGGEEFIIVVLDPNCPTGHHVFADSENNGPWGKALTTEFIPYIEKKYRGTGKPEFRYVTGHSSGGWSSLWLQVTYPGFFGGVWSTSPDPVDFRDFQRVNLYEHGVNMFTDGDGKPRPIARMGDRPFLFYKQFSDMEVPIRGEQLGSFEAVFSPKGKDGQPLQLWNRLNGAVNNDVALAWRKYDIGLILRTKWKELEPKLKGKLHVYTGNMDTFYLEGAVKLLQKDMAELGSDAKIELFPGDHGSVLTRELRDRIDKEMADQVRSARLNTAAPGSS